MVAALCSKACIPTSEVVGCGAEVCCRYVVMKLVRASPLMFLVITVVCHPHVTVSCPCHPKHCCHFTSPLSPHTASTPHCLRACLLPLTRHMLPHTPPPPQMSPHTSSPPHLLPHPLMSPHPPLLTCHQTRPHALFTPPSLFIPSHVTPHAPAQPCRPPPVALRSVLGLPANWCRRPCGTSWAPGWVVGGGEGLRGKEDKPISNM